MRPDRLADLHRRYDGMNRHAYTAEHPISHIHELLAYVTRLRDEIDSLNASLDDARTDWHDLAAERDQARQIARVLATALTISCGELDGEDNLTILITAWGDWNADNPLPEWLTEQDPKEPTP